jgi:segregation and condensation protein B
MELESKIESFLFFKGEPQTNWEIAVAMRVDPVEIPPALESLEKSLAGRGVTLVRHGDSVMLGTTPEMSAFFEELRKEELNKELSKAALETLSIILYKDSVTRSEINFIRGVNSGYILRNLEIRGLIDRVSHKSDARMYVYKPSLELLSYLGVSSVADLPQFETLKKTLETKLSGQESAEQHEN